MSDTVIKVENLSKQYRIGAREAGYRTFRETIVDSAKAPFQRIAKLFNRQSSIINRQSRKIASIGVRVSKFVAHHGMAINICNDLSIFDLLVPCGLENVEMTSVLKETGKRHSMSRLKKNVADLLVAHFS